MADKVQETVRRFIRELKQSHPDVKVEVLGKQPDSSADNWVLITCRSRDDVADIMETEARLTTGYYLDEGVYIQAMADYSTPVATEEKKAVNILITCNRPKSARGEYRFTKFEDLFRWLAKIKALAKGAPSHWLYGLAKNGSYNPTTAETDIEITCAPMEYIWVNELARETGLLKSQDRISPSREAALAFAQALDQRVLEGVARFKG